MKIPEKNYLLLETAIKELISQPLAKLEENLDKLKQALDIIGKNYLD